MKLRNGQPESTRTDKDRAGWRRNGEGDLIVWTPEEAHERKLSRELALEERGNIIAKIKRECPEIK